MNTTHRPFCWLLLVLSLGILIGHNPNDPKLYDLRGSDYAIQGNFPQAISDFTKIIEINPNDTKAYTNRARAYVENKEYDKAWEDVHKAEELGAVVDSGLISELKKESGRAN